MDVNFLLNENKHIGEAVYKKAWISDTYYNWLQFARKMIFVHGLPLVNFNNKNSNNKGMQSYRKLCQFSI